MLLMQACSEEEAEASLAIVQAADTRLPDDAQDRLDYLTKRSKELDRKISNHERQLGRNLDDLEVGPALHALHNLLWLGRASADRAHAGCCLSRALIAMGELP